MSLSKPQFAAIGDIELNAHVTLLGAGLIRQPVHDAANVWAPASSLLPKQLQPDRGVE